MKDKVLAALGLKYKGKSLSKTFLESIATVIAAGITEENDIEGKITELDALINETANEGNRRATEAALKAKAPAPDPITPDPEPAPVNETPTDKLLKQLLEKVTKLESEKAQTSIKSKLAELVGKDVPQSILDLVAMPDSEDKIEALAETIKTSWATSKQAINNNGLGGDKPNGSQGSGVKEKVSPAVAAFITKAANERKETV